MKQHSTFNTIKKHAIQCRSEYNDMERMQRQVKENHTK